MDPYGDHNRKIMSPLDKPTIRTVEVVTTTVEEKTNQEIQPEPGKKEFKENSSLVDHLSELRKQLIKGIATFLLFFIVVFATINIWFPHVTRGHELIVLGPLEVVKFYMSISTALSVGLALPFLCHFL